MERRSFLKLSSAFPVGAVSASLVLHEAGKDDVTLDISVLKTQPGDVLVLSLPGPISQETAHRLQSSIEVMFQGLKAIVMADGLKVDGVIRGANGFT